MAKRRLEVYLDDITESIVLIQSFVEGVTSSDFENNIEKQDAVIRRLSIIGEAVKHIPAEIRLAYPEIPWRDAAGLRDIVIHEYFGVSTEVIWNVAVKELPLLYQQIKMVRNNLG